MDLENIESLMKLMKEHEVSLVEYENKNSGERIKLRSLAIEIPTRSHLPAPQPVAVSTQPQTAGAEKTAGTKLKTNQSFVRSPFIGTYYESPSPGSDPFVKVGQKIKKGDVLCIVEAMKLMNEIESEVDGSIVEFLLQNGSPLEYNQPIYIIE